MIYNDLVYYESEFRLNLAVSMSRFARASKIIINNLILLSNIISETCEITSPKVSLNQSLDGKLINYLNK